MMENFFILAKPNASFIAEWMGEYLFALRNPCEIYLRTLGNRGVSLLTVSKPFIQSRKCYLLAYASYQKVAQRRLYLDNEFQQLLFSAHEDGGPYMYTLGKMDSVAAISRMTMLKLTKEVRQSLEEVLTQFVKEKMKQIHRRHQSMREPFQPRVRMGLN